MVHVDDYLIGQIYLQEKNIQVINLCRNHSYLSVGYYTSLLAEARGHRILPTVKSMLNLSRKSMYSLDTESIDEQSRKLFVSAFDAYRKKQWRIPKGKTAARYDL
ncbi:MAG: RimK-like ATPgrasp N-terminal domain-containing protein, partial [Epsilonproteobacteria bacterium]|nr:RimK-like ATPgrasp N-terminal domain-containing protein [Campylobacterota bacterium]